MFSDILPRPKRKVNVRFTLYKASVASKCFILLETARYHYQCIVDGVVIIKVTIFCFSLCWGITTTIYEQSLVFSNLPLGLCHYQHYSGSLFAFICISTDFDTFYFTHSMIIAYGICLVENIITITTFGLILTLLHYYDYQF